MKHFALLLTLAIALASAAAARADDEPAIPPPSDDAAVWYLTSLLQIERAIKSFDDPVEAYQTATNTDTAGFDLEKAGPVIDRLQEELDWARRGTTLDKCRWPVTLVEDGPYAQLPNLREMRQLARLLIVSAMVKDARGDIDGATRDMVAVMRLARHSASDHTVIATLVQLSIESLGVQALTYHLHRYDRAQLQALDQELNRLPPKVSMAQAMKTERSFALWIERVYKQEGYAAFKKKYIGLMQNGGGGGAAAFPSEAELKKMIAGLNKSYDEIERVMALPPQAFKEAADKFEQDVQASPNPLVKLMMPALSAARKTEFRSDSQAAMLRAMIAYRLGGLEAFKKVIDPISGEIFDMDINDASVVISSRSGLVKRGDEPLSLTFPADAGKPLGR